MYPFVFSRPTAAPADPAKGSKDDSKRNKNNDGAEGSDDRSKEGGGGGGGEQEEKKAEEEGKRDDGGQEESKSSGSGRRETNGRTEALVGFMSVCVGCWCFGGSFRQHPVSEPAQARSQIVCTAASMNYLAVLSSDVPRRMCPGGCACLPFCPPARG